MIKDSRDSRVGSENYCYPPGDLDELVNLTILNGFNQQLKGVAPGRTQKS